MVYVEALSKVLPVILLFLLGAFLNKLHFIRSEAIQDMKKLVLNVTLPAILFLAFSRVSLEARHLLIVGAVFSACVVTLPADRLIRSLAHIKSPLLSYADDAFKAGMMGYAIFGGFLTTPVILSILLGILANRASVMPPLNAWPVSAAALKTVEMVSGLTTPQELALFVGGLKFK